MSDLEYQVFLNYEVGKHLKPIRGIRKKEMISFLEALRSDPFIKGDFQKEVDGRVLQIKVFGRHSLYYFSDHAVKEVKVVEFLKSDEH